MEINKNVSRETNETEKLDINKVNDAFNQTLVYDGITYKMKRLKGKLLLTLCTEFGFANMDLLDTSNKKNIEALLYEKLVPQYDLAMQSLQYSKDGEHFNDLSINGIVQIPEIEDDVVLMYKLLYFVFETTMVFMGLSHKQSVVTK